MKKLIELSKTKGKLDALKIAKIAKMLKRNELKEYIFLLRRARLEEVLIVEAPTNLTKKSLQSLKKMFKDKEIIVNQRENAVAGMKLFIKDSIIDFTVKGALERIKKAYE